MSISCSIIRDPNDPSKILFTEAPNGARSELFDGLQAQTWDQNRALELWLTSKTTKFRETVVTPKVAKHRIRLASRVGNIQPNTQYINVTLPEGKTVTLDLENMDFRVEQTPDVKPLVGPRVPVLSIDEQKALVKLERNDQGQILAPNGKVSNLKEEHARLVRTPAFKQWFGDWDTNPKDSSQVVDENGEPKVYFHGSPVQNIKKFNREESGRLDSGLKEYGTYFTTSRAVAEIYKNVAAKTEQELEPDIQEKIDKLERAWKDFAFTEEGDAILEEIEELRKGRIYEVFLNIRPGEAHSFDANGLAGVEAYDQLEVDAGYKIARNRDAMSFIKEGRFGVEQRKAINAKNIAEVESWWFKNKMSPSERQAVTGETYLILDGNEDTIRMATNTEFGLAQQQVRQAPRTTFTLNAYAYPKGGGQGVKLGRVRYVVRGNEMMIDNSTLSNLDAELFDNRKVTIDPDGVRMQTEAGSRIGKGLSITKRGAVKTENDDLSMEYVRKNAEASYIKNANIIKEYPIVRGVKKFNKATTAAQADKIYEVFVEQVKNNLIYLTNEFDPALKDISSVWYDGANKIAHDLANKWGHSPEKAAAIIAALSPQKNWDMNIRLADLVFEAFSENPVFTKEMVKYQRGVIATQVGAMRSKKSEAEIKKAEAQGEKFIKALETHVGKTLDQIPDEWKAYPVRLYHEVKGNKDYMVHRPDGVPVKLATNKDGSKSKLAWGSYSEIGKAVAIYLNDSPQNISEQLGNMHKVRNFYNNIIDPMSKAGDVTMDTHAIAAALMQPFGASALEVKQNFGHPASSSKAAGVSGLYFAYAEAYRRAGEELGLLPRQVQSITWEASRGLFPDTFKTTGNARKARAVWDKFKTNKITIDEAREEIKQLAGGIDQPIWAELISPESDTSVGAPPVEAGVLGPVGADTGLGAGAGAVGGGRPNVRGGLKGLGIGATMYAALFKEGLRQGYNVVSSDNLSPEARALWGKLVKLGVAKDLGNRFMLDSHPSGFDLNGEPSPAMVMDYSDRLAYTQELTAEEENELYDIMSGLPVESTESLLTALKNGFMPQGRFQPTRESLTYTGLYDSETISEIMVNSELQEQIREFIYKLEKLDKVYLNDMYTDEVYSVVEDGSRTPIGTFKLMNPFQVEQLAIQKLGGFETREEFEEALYTDDIQEMVGSAYEAFKATGQDLFYKLRKFKPTNEVILEEGQLVPRTTGVKETMRQVMMTPSSRQLETDADLLLSLPEEVWYTDPNITNELLTNIERGLRAVGMDIEGLPQMSRVNGVEATRDFLEAVLDYGIEDNNASIDALAEAYQEFYEIKDRYKKVKKNVGTDTDSRNLFSLTSPLTGVELFTRENMIPIGKGIYKRVEPLSTDQLLNVMYDHLSSTGGYGGILPEAALKPAAADEDGTLNMAKVQDPKNRAAIIRSMKSWVESEVGKLFIGDLKVSPESLQAYILMFHYYNKSDSYDKFETHPLMSHEYRLVSNPVTNVNYLTTLFIGETNVKALNEKKKNSRAWKNYYSNLVFNSNGIELKSDDPISLNRMQPYLMEDPDMVNYFRIHKDKPELMPETVEEVLIDDLFRRNYYTNYPTALRPFRGEYTALTGNTISAKSKAPFLRTMTGIYEFVEGIGAFGIYTKHQVNQGPLKRYDPTLAPQPMDAVRSRLRDISSTVQSTTQIKNLYDADEAGRIDEKYDNCR